MKIFANKRKLLAIIPPVLIICVLTISGLATTWASFTDQETGADNSFQAWNASEWQQTTQVDFEAGVNTQLDTSSSAGDVMLATFSNTVTDTFDDETNIASKRNIFVTGGQVKLTSSGGTETLRPNAAGDETSLGYQSPEAGYHWDKVDEAVADEDSTHVS